MLKRLFGAMISVPLIAACAGGGANVTSSQLQTQSQLQSGNVTEAQSDAILKATGNPITVPYSADLLYVSNTGNQSVTVYRNDLSGNAAPMYVIQGPKTGLTNVGQLSEDASGNLYVANGSSLLVFAHGANGNVAPIRKLAGPNTGIHSIVSMTVDKITGKIFVSDINSFDATSNAILRFPPNANGNEAPFAASNNHDAQYLAIASDSTGNNLISASYTGSEAVELGITTFGKQFANGAQLQHVYDINALRTTAITDDPTTKTYLAVANIPRQPSQIVRFAENTVGTGLYVGGLSVKPATVSILNATAEQLALGYLRNIYATTGNAVNVYEHDASGDAKPIRILTGNATRLNGAYGVYEGK